MPPARMRAQPDVTRTLCARGNSSQIAKAIGGVTRNAVIGKVHRMQFDARGPDQKDRKPRSRKRLRGKIRTIRMLQPTVNVEREPRGPVQLVDLEPHHCRWPYGRRLPFTFCGCDRVARSAYCAVHTGESREQAEQTNASPERGKQTAITSPVAYHGDEYACRSQRAA